VSDRRSPVRPSRVERAERSRRGRRRLAAAVAAGLVVAAIGFVLLTRDDGSQPASATPADGGPGGSQPRTLALQVDGAPAPMLAVIGVPAEGDPFAMPLSSELTVVMPGQGETSAAGIAALPAPSMRVALSNMSGLWIDHYVSMPLRDLMAGIDAAGGISADLPEAYPTTSGVLGPGEVTMTGAQAKAFLAGATDDAGVRWEILLTAMFAADPPALADGADVETDDPDAANAVLAEAEGAEILAMPTERVTATIIVPVYPALDDLLSSTLGTPQPVPTIVQNGSGEPGVGEAVATRIIPAGFRVVLAQNAQTFDVSRTDIFANGPDHEGEARAVREALGVGRVRVAAVPSNVGDITIVVGEDFTA
jgi:LytR cell envelope-related transcriptional attenuator